MQRQFSRTAEAEDEKKRAQEEYMREQAERRREQIEGRRGLWTFLKFWMVCADRRCTRARKCAGNVEACFDRFWPHVPEYNKNKIRHAIVFMNDGMAPREAAVAAIAYVDQRKRIKEETKAREAARGPAFAAWYRTQWRIRHGRADRGQDPAGAGRRRA